METSPIQKPGILSTEFHLSAVVTVAGLVFAGAAMFVGAAESSGVQLPPWVRAVGVVAGIGTALATAAGYRKTRTQLKLEGIKATVTPMLPQLLGLVNQVVDVVKDIKAGGLTAPADDSPSQQLAGVVGHVEQLASVVKLLAPASTPLSTAIAGAAEQLADRVGDAAAARIQTDKQAVAELNEK